MGTIAKQFVMIAILALAGLAQTSTDTSVEKVFRFTATDTPRGVPPTVDPKI